MLVSESSAMHNFAADRLRNHNWIVYLGSSNFVRESAKRIFAIAARALNSLARICGPKRARIKVGLLVALRLFERAMRTAAAATPSGSGGKGQSKKKFPGS